MVGKRPGGQTLCATEALCGKEEPNFPHPSSSLFRVFSFFLFNVCVGSIGGRRAQRSLCTHLAWGLIRSIRSDVPPIHAECRVCYCLPLSICTDLQALFASRTRTTRRMQRKEWTGMCGFLLPGLGVGRGVVNAGDADPIKKCQQERSVVRDPPPLLLSLSS